MNRAIREADRIGAEAQAAIDACYNNALAPVIEKHRATMERMQAYEAKGKTALSRALFRTSGLRMDLTAAVLSAGKEADAILSRQRSGIMEVMADDDGT